MLSIAGLDDCRDEQRVRVAGLLVMHQAPPTAKGFRLLTLEDEEGLVNIILKPQVYERYHAVVRGSGLLIIEGRLQREPGIVNMVAERVTALG